MTLRAKEGLALINGTDGILGMLVLALADLGRLLRIADVDGVDVGRGAARRPTARSPPICWRCDRSRARRASAANLRRLLAGSEIVASHRENDTRGSGRLLAAVRPAGATAPLATPSTHAERVAAAELDAAIDNPMILPDGRVESCGNFHGAPLAFACDFLAIAAAEVGAIAERRTDRLLDATRSARAAAVPGRRTPASTRG